jgi:hypothetical protein
VPQGTAANKASQYPKSGIFMKQEIGKLKPTDILIQYRHKKQLEKVLQCCLTYREQRKGQSDSVNNIVAIWRLARTKYRGKI